MVFAFNSETIRAASIKVNALCSLFAASSRTASRWALVMVTTRSAPEAIFAVSWRARRRMLHHPIPEGPPPRLGESGAQSLPGFPRLMLRSREPRTQRRTRRRGAPQWVTDKCYQYKQTVDAGKLLVRAGKCGDVGLHWPMRRRQYAPLCANTTCGVLAMIRTSHIRDHDWTYTESRCCKSA